MDSSETAIEKELSWEISLLHRIMLVREQVMEIRSRQKIPGCRALARKDLEHGLP